MRETPSYRKRVAAAVFGYVDGLRAGAADGDKGLGCPVDGIAQGQCVALSTINGTLTGDKDRPCSRTTPRVHIGTSLIEGKRCRNLVASACAFAIHITACGRSAEG